MDQRGIVQVGIRRGVNTPGQHMTGRFDALGIGVLLQKSVNLPLSLFLNVEQVQYTKRPPTANCDQAISRSARCSATN